MENVKKCEVANIFYPSDAKELEQFLNQTLKSKKLKTSKPPKALIVPHAGFIYSGSCAAHTYKILEKFKKNYQTIYIFGPAHHIYFKGLRSIENEYYNTPLGNLKIAETELNNLLKRDLIIKNNQAFKNEHSVEVQLPFIYKIFSDQIKIVPILVGGRDIEDAYKALKEIINEPDSLIIISTDLSHFLNLEEEQEIDTQTINQIENLETINHDQACGATALNALLKIAKEKDLKIKNLNFSNSSKKSKDKDSVVGYASFLVS